MATAATTIRKPQDPTTPVKTPLNARTGGATTPAFSPVSSSNFGLNLTSNAPNPYGSLTGGPETVGQFNRSVLGEAQPQYQPQLQQISAQVPAEQRATQERRTDIGSIFNQYQQQAQQTYNQVRNTLGELIAQNQAGGPGGGPTLNAALAAAAGPTAQLRAQMGMAPQDSAAPYANAAANAATATRDLMGQGIAASLGGPATALSLAPAERASELNTESQRYQAAIQGLRSQQQAVVEQIPGIIEKTRQQMITDISNAQALRFQERLAGKQFGLQAGAQAFQQSQAKAAAAQTALVNRWNHMDAQAQLRQNAAAIAANTRNANIAAQNALYKAQGKAHADAIKYLTTTFAPTKQELKSVSTPGQGKGGLATDRTQVLANPGRWHLDLGNILKTLMDQYGLSQQDALGMMSEIGGLIPYTATGMYSQMLGQPYGDTVQSWANTFNQRLALRPFYRGIAGPIAQMNAPPPKTTGITIPKAYYRSGSKTTGRGP